MLQITMGESRVQQERFPQPWLAQEGDTLLSGLKAGNEGLQSSLMAPTQKEHVWGGRIRERIALEVIKIEKHAYDSHTTPKVYLLRPSGSHVSCHVSVNDSHLAL
jgi:hypothetical protein